MSEQMCENSQTDPCPNVASEEWDILGMFRIWLCTVHSESMRERFGPPLPSEAGPT